MSNKSDSCPLISVIVPIYNTEKYLDRCVASILGQTYRNLEVILVDDGSPDNCPAMCDAWAEKDSRIKVIHKKNEGPDIARNSGLDAARGELIGTVDSDDYLAPDMYAKLYALLAENDADMSICGFIEVDEGGKAIDVNDKAMPDEVLTGLEMFAKYTSNLGYCYSWNKLYRAEVFRHLRFKGGCHDDTGTIHRIIGACGKIAVSSEPLYFYVRRRDSTTGKLASLSFRYSSFSEYSQC